MLSAYRLIDRSMIRTLSVYLMDLQVAGGSVSLHRQINQVAESYE
jgi:hypothetical protein